MLKSLLAPWDEDIHLPIRFPVFPKTEVGRLPTGSGAGGGWVCATAGPKDSSYENSIRKIPRVVFIQIVLCKIQGQPC